jgi:hypothetical protein
MALENRMAFLLFSLALKYSSVPIGKGYKYKGERLCLFTMYVNWRTVTLGLKIRYFQLYK